MTAAFKDKDRLRYQEFLQVIDGKTTGAARASLGLATTFADVYRFWDSRPAPRPPLRHANSLSRPTHVPAAPANPRTTPATSHRPTHKQPRTTRTPARQTPTLTSTTPEPAHPYRSSTSEPTMDT